MVDLSTHYMNLTLKNPVIVASSGLTKSIEKIQACEEAGAGAVVLKSLFEEALAEKDFGIAASAPYHTEAYDYLRSELEMQYGPQDYTDLIRDAKSKTSIPIIASINCVSEKWWPNFAKKIQAAGADALELNVFTTAVDQDVDSMALEKLYFAILDKVKGQIKIPVALKIGMYFTALPHFVVQLDRQGVDAVVLFNRFTEPDIDINKLELRTTFAFSNRYDLYRPLRWTALLSGRIGCDIAATTGVNTSEDVIKLLLAGASVVQVASVLYKNGLEKIDELLNGLELWMEKHKFNAIDDFKGSLSFAETNKSETYLRTQFIEKIRGVE